ncbi:MAG: hypothetical protein R3B09_28840 [Nannocystaceae bacterium]
MEVKKRNRAELKSYFVRNAIPTENNFADLIDATLVQASDGVVKPAGDPLSIEAVGDDTSRKQVLNFYRAFTDNAPAFSLELSPRADPNVAASARAGLSVSDGAGQSRLFVDAGTGKLGVGTVAPESPLHVRGEGIVALLESIGADASLRIGTREGPSKRVAIANRSGRLALVASGGSDALSVVADGRVGIACGDPLRALHVDGSGQVSLMRAGSVVNDGEPGLYWHVDGAYAIRRSAGPWTDPNYQQLVVNWPTGILLQPGTGNNTGYAKSYVEINNGKGLRITQGSLAVGGVDPGVDKVVIAANASDMLRVQFATAGSGTLHFISWSGGWNLNAATDGRHLYLNRDSGPSSNLYLGRAGVETQVLADGRVGVCGTPGSDFRLDVHGSAYTRGYHRVDEGLIFGYSNRGGHLEVDGALYHFDGQAYLTVDDNFYIRDLGGEIKFHFNTDSGRLEQQPWQAPAFTQGWTNYDAYYNPAGYYLDKQGTVHLRGLVRSGTAGWEATIFVLPGGYRPSYRQLFVVCTAENVVGRVDINPDGRVIPVSVNNAWVSLDSISFRP